MFVCCFSMWLRFFSLLPNAMYMTPAIAIDVTAIVLARSCICVVTEITV